VSGKYYVAMSYDAGEMGQSDYLYLLKLSNGKIVGYSSEFEIYTYDIGEACSPEKHHLAQWLRWPDDEKGWKPAMLEEIKLLNLDKCLIGTKKDTQIRTSVDPF
jgi:hypothetical protein